MVTHLVVTISTKIEIEASHTFKTRSADGIRMTAVTAENEIQRVNYMTVRWIMRTLTTDLNTDEIKLCASDILLRYDEENQNKTRMSKIIFVYHSSY